MKETDLTMTNIDIIQGYKQKHLFISDKGVSSVVYLMDCMDGMKQMPENYFSLAIVDPPYGINAPSMQMGHNPNRKGKGQYPGESTAVKIKRGRLNSGGGHMKNSTLVNSDCSWDSEPPTPEYFSSLMSISENQIIWGGNYFSLPPTRCMICWDKLQPWDNFSQFELAWTSFDKPTAMFRYSNTGGLNHEKKIHPTQKPIKLYEWLISKYLMWGGILDTHLGSGSSRIAAHKAGVPFMGFEKDEKYFKDSVKRFETYTSQLRLF